MANIIGVKCNNSKKIKYYECNIKKLKLGDYVIIKNESSIVFGKIISLKKVNIDNIVIKDNISVATKNEINKFIENRKLEKKAFYECKKILKNYDANIKLIDSEFTFNREQLIFRFISENRIDFRNIVKDLALIYKTRIEMRQIGVRDKAKELGGLGLCGMEICCSRFLINFDTISINMAKNQNLSLNPNKINGVCGRLLCCLNYENNNYLETKNRLPKIGDFIEYEDKIGKVIELNIIDNSYVIQYENKEKKIIKCK